MMLLLRATVDTQENLSLSYKTHDNDIVLLQMTLVDNTSTHIFHKREFLLVLLRQHCCLSIAKYD